MKKLLILFVAFGLTACGSATNEDAHNGEKESSEHEHAATDETTQEESTKEENHDQHEEHSTTENDQHEEHSTTEEGHDHHVEGVTAELELATQVKHGEATPLKVKVIKDGQPLNDINVKLEMTVGKGSNPTWVTVPFAGEGQYEVNHTFSKAGEYNVVIHLSDGKELHDHFEQTVTVQ